MSVGLRRLWILPAAALVLAGCSEDGPVAPPDPGGGAMEYLSCQADLAAGGISCIAPQGSPGGASGSIIGGQGIYIQVASNNVGYDETSEIFSADVAVKNLSSQVLGSSDGKSSDPAGVRVFFVDAPSVEGAGVVTIANADGRGNFSGSDQPYFEYSQAITPGETSLPRTWEWSVPSTVTRFNFMVGVSAEVTDESTLVPGLNFLAKTVAADSQHSCMIDLDGQAWCWGRAGYGKLGQGAALSQNLATPQKVQQGDRRFVSISAGMFHTCALDERGAAYCWGNTGLGRLGDGTDTGNRTTPVAVLGGHEFIQIDAGRRFTCGVTVEHDAWCWGSNSHGELGDGTNETRVEPTPVAGGHKFASVGVGKVFTCGVTLGGETYCWGAGTVGRLGTGNTVTQNLPTLVVGGHDFVRVTGGNNHTCALTPEGEAWCWGSGANHKLGALTETGSAVTGENPSPHRVVTDLRFVDIGLGHHHTCALSTEGKAYCWGHGDTGKIGDGTTGPIGNISSPAEVVGDHRFIGLSVGSNYACGTTAARDVYCWGGGEWGQLGNGQFDDSGDPVLVLPRGD